MKKRLFSLLLVGVMGLGLFPTVACADDHTANGSSAEVQTTEGGNLDALIGSIEDAYATQDLSLAWENVGLKDVDFSTATKNAAVLAAIEAIKADIPVVGAVMKGIFTLAALGYDPTDIILLDDTALNAMDVLKGCADATADYYFYTAPFALLALGLDETPTASQIDAHIDCLVTGLADGETFAYGVDTPAMTIMGLAPYYGRSEVETAVDSALVTIAGRIGAGGTYGTAETDAMVILAYTMLGKDPTTLTASDGASVVDGILSYQCSDGTGFGHDDTQWNLRATYQGLLALKALAEFEQTNSAVNPFDLTATAINSIDEADLQPSAGGDTGSGDTGSGESITVTVNISDNGAFVTGKDGVTMAGVEVTLDGSEHATHNIDGALKQAHALYYDGVDGYASSDGDYGLSLNKLWGDISYNWGYQVNGGTESVSGLAHALDDGSVVDGYINGGDYYSGTLEPYSRFDTIPTATVGEAVTVTLEYTNDWGYSFSPCAGATIYIDGVTTDVVTDANGEANITFDTAGNHWLTAKKDANNDGITDIVAPYATASVTGSSGGGSGSIPGGSGFDVTFSVVDNQDRTWFTETVELDQGDTVKDAFEAAFAENPTYTYEVDGGTYVESITHPTYGTYGEFTNGNNSGWKYKVNGSAPTGTAYSSYTVEEDDEIVFYFVVDYTSDKTPSSGGSFSTKTEEDETGTASVFTDLDSHAWCYEAIDYVVSEGLFQGTTDTTFNPNGAMTRSMIWMVLARHAGLDTETDGAAWYQVGQDWAIETGLSDGTNPDGNISRQQLAVMLYRYAVEDGEDVSVGESTNILSYTDVFEVDEYAIPAMQWACGAGIINGTSESTLSPNGNATRAQVATMLMRYLAQ